MKLLAIILLIMIAGCSTTQNSATSGFWPSTWQSETTK